MNDSDFRDQNLHAKRYSTQRVQAENFTVQLPSKAIKAKCSNEFKKELCMSEKEGNQRIQLLSKKMDVR